MAPLETVGITRVLAVQGPLQYAAGAIAMAWFAKRAPAHARARHVLVMYDFLMPEALEPGMVEAIETLAAGALWDRTVFIGASQMDRLVRGRYSRAIDGIKAVIGESQVDELYLARDFCGSGSALIANAYDGAIKLAYGDSLGLIGDRRQFSGVDWAMPVRACMALGRRMARRLLLGGPRPVHFDHAVLSLPLDLSHGEMREVPLSVPSRRHVQECFSAISSGVKFLQQYAQTLLDGTSGRSHLVLLSNLSASGLMTQDDEIALYIAIIRQAAAADDTVLLKIHPRSSSDVLDAVCTRLGGQYRLKVIDDKALLRIPVELWSDLIRACNVIAVFSTSALNIKYLYDKDVALPFDAAMIARYVYPLKVDYVAEACRMISESVSALEQWDGATILWRKYS